MEVNLSKDDLVSLVSGTSPGFSLIGNFTRIGYGTFSDNHGWSWYKYELEELTEQQLYDIYQMCKKSWENWMY